MTAPAEEAAAVIPAAPPARKGGLPGWAIVLIVIGVCFVIVLPVVIIAAVVFLGNEASQTFSVTSSELFPY